MLLWCGFASLPAWRGVVILELLFINTGDDLQLFALVFTANGTHQSSSQNMERRSR